MEFTPADLWTRVLASARTAMPEQSFRTWLAGTRAVGVTDEALLVEAPSAFHVEWIEDKYGPALQEIVDHVVGHPLKLSFRIAEDGAAPEIPSVEVRAQGPTGDTTDAPKGPNRVPPSDHSRPGSPGEQVERRSTSHSPAAASLNERYTFDRFVVGSNNQLAAAASHAVAEKPARMYNPLFLYGGVGLGKTHLMHAIGHAVLQRSPRRRVAYVTSERFMNELVGAIQAGTTGDFRRRYRQIDLLLVDDVHFLEKKEGTQEEFFHTFNALYDAGKQVVLTCDRPPKELPGLEDRLVSRFEWGLVVDIKPPDYETRVAILRKKATDDRLALGDEVIDFIARSCTSSVRELEGAVIKLLAYSSLRREEIDLQLARIALQGVLRKPSPGPTSGVSPEEIRDEVARIWNVSASALASRRRTREVTEPRQVAMYLIREVLDRSLQNIGDLFGGRDHSTVIYAIQKVGKKMLEDESFARQVEELKARFLSS